ncbi:MAG: hypothetical protein RI988_3157 [Pseudomonadota bacterium]|jgi:uncharacterized membrane protein (UPF0127 family)
MICIKSAAKTSSSVSRLGALALASVLLWLSGLQPACAQAVPQPRLPTTELGVGMHNIVAELARTPQQQQIGMMMRTRMEQHEGMLFVFDEPAPRCFWMRNTLLPLAIAFIADDGTIVNIAEMQPQSDDSHCAAKPVRFALEMNKGWFAKRGIQPGMKLRGAPFAAPRPPR